MNDTIAFLRGINISGKNKIAMPALTSALEANGFTNVSTLLNSGNIRFSSDQSDLSLLRRQIESLILDRFGLTIPAYLIRADRLSQLLQNAPDWWGTEDPAVYHQMIFILSDDTPQAIAEELGPLSDPLEKAQIHEEVVFWSFDRALYQKCNWWKRTASAGIAGKLTIRTAGTVRKLCR